MPYLKHQNILCIHIFLTVPQFFENWNRGINYHNIQGCKRIAENPISIRIRIYLGIAIFYQIILGLGYPHPKLNQMRNRISRFFAGYYLIRLCILILKNQVEWSGLVGGQSITDLLFIYIIIFLFYYSGVEIERTIISL